VEMRDIFYRRGATKQRKALCNSNFLRYRIYRLRRVAWDLLSSLRYLCFSCSLR